MLNLINCPPHFPMIMLLGIILSIPYDVSTQDSNSVTKKLLFCAEDLKEVNQHFFSMLPRKLKPSVNFSDYLSSRGHHLSISF